MRLSINTSTDQSWAPKAYCCGIKFRNPRPNRKDNTKIIDGFPLLSQGSKFGSMPGLTQVTITIQSAATRVDSAHVEISATSAMGTLEAAIDQTNARDQEKMGGPGMVPWQVGIIFSLSSQRS